MVSKDANREELVCKNLVKHKRQEELLAHRENLTSFLSFPFFLRQVLLGSLAKQTIYPPASAFQMLNSQGCATVPTQLTVLVSLVKGPFPLNHV